MKKRLDVLLTERGLAPSREKAKAIIMAGIVYVNNQKEDKAGATFPEDAAVEVRGQTLRYVSRGGLKLEKAMQCFPIDLNGRICMDIGASTGGFTDCMLQNGAAKVYAIDVGYGQLDWKLREDPRVVCMEKTNFRYVTPEDLDPDSMPDFASVDVSFISLSRILPPAAAILPEGGEMVCLIKPQFEAGREKVGKKGVVRDPRVHEEVIVSCLGIARDAGFTVEGLSWSPIRGPEGNIEYLMYLRRCKDSSAQDIPEKKETGKQNTDPDSAGAADFADMEMADSTGTNSGDPVLAKDAAAADTISTDTADPAGAKDAVAAADSVGTILADPAGAKDAVGAADSVDTVKSKLSSDIDSEMIREIVRRSHEKL